jgi:hypothetical protein
METAERTEPQFRSLGAILAFEYRSYGADHLKAVLATMVENETRREFVLEAAAELKAIGVPIADEVLKAALQCPSMCDVDIFCSYARQPPPISPRANESNVRMWIWSQERRAKAKREQCEALLAQAGIDPGWLNGENGQ